MHDTRCVFLDIKMSYIVISFCYDDLDKMSGRYDGTARTVKAIAELYGKQSVAYRNSRGSAESDLSGREQKGLSGFNELRDKFRRISVKATDILSTRLAAVLVSC
jgi:hypothetical protein